MIRISGTFGQGETQKEISSSVKLTGSLSWMIGRGNDGIPHRDNVADRLVRLKREEPIAAKMTVHDLKFIPANFIPDNGQVYWVLPGQAFIHMKLRRF